MFFSLKKRKEQCKSKLADKNHCSPYMTAADILQDFMDQSSGSGSGLPLLVSTSTLKKIRIGSC